MNRTWLGLGWLFGVVFLLFTFGSQVAHGQVRETPETLVLRFEESAASLDQPGVRAAIAQELNMTLADSGSDQAATLIVSVTPSGEVQVTFRPDRQTLTRSVPIANTSDVPRLIAQLAGNMVRSEANTLIAELQPPAAAPTPATGTSTHPPLASTTPASTYASATSTDAAPPSTPHAYLHDAWIFSVLGGFDMFLIDEAPVRAQLTLQLSRRFGRLEIGAGARLAYGEMHVTAYGGPGGDLNDGRIYGYQVTLPVTAEYRVLGAQDAYLQLGVGLGLRTAGVMNRSDSITSGSGVYPSAGVQATAGFRLADNHGLVLRVGWDFWPPAHRVSSGDTEYDLSPVPQGFNVGWQIGW